MPSCLVCGRPKVKAKGRCTACLEFLRRNKRDKTEEEIVATNVKRYEAALIRKRIVASR